MGLQEIISEQLRLGNGLCVGGDNILCRAVGRKAAQEAADVPALSAADGEAIAQQAVINAAVTARAELPAVDKPITVDYVEPEDPENLTADEDAAAVTYAAYTAELHLYNIYAGKLAGFSRAEKLATQRKADAVKRAANIRQSHERLGQTDQLERDPAEVMVKDLLRFVSKKAGSKACAACDSTLRAYVAANPGATLVKVYKFEDSPAMICTADGTVVVRVDFAVSGG